MPPTKTKKERKSLTIETKIKILNSLAGGISRTDVCKKYNLKYTTLKSIISKENTIRSSFSNGSDKINATSCYVRDNLVVKMDKALLLWIADNNRKKIPLNGEVIKQKALGLYSLLRRDQQSSSQMKQFQASNGWLQKFVKRNSIKNVKMKGECASADEEAASLYPVEFAKIVEQGGYSPHQVFNADESGLFWKRTPNTTYTIENSASGFKTAKERVTIMFCSNASGEKFMKPMMISNSLKPRAMKGINVESLPVYWRANKKAWMTKDLFDDWLRNCFIPEAKAYCEEKNLPFKVLLTLDNASSHSTFDHPNVQLQFLPPNTTSLLQPLDQGIISVFKKYYVKQAFRCILDKLDADDSLSLPAAWKSFTIRDCVNFVGTACLAVKRSTLNNCWKKLWPASVKFEEDLEQTELDTHIIQLGKRIGDDKFSSEQVEALLADEPISDDELLELINEEDETLMETEDIENNDQFNPDKLAEGIAKAEALCDFFIDNDPSLERAVAFKCEMMACMSRYMSLSREGAQKNLQLCDIDDSDSVLPEVLDGKF